MTFSRFPACLAGGLLLLAQGAFAQGAEQQSPQSAEQTGLDRSDDASPEIDADNMADSLNAGQQIRQSFTFTRTINGEVVETDKRTITYSRTDPVRPTESGKTPLQELQEAFNREVLTRTEAFEEAKLDFVTADVNHDNVMTADEFVGLVMTWRETNARTAPATDQEIARQRQYQAFIEEIDPEGAAMDAEQAARQKYDFMSGASETMTREDYIREYLLDFDSMDHDNSMILRGDELMMFRALNRGETLTTEER